MAVTYVPDTAPVRQKMLFASTRLTLVRELGTEHFRETIFATTAAELTPAGFDKHDAHTALDAPLTEEEKSLGEVKRAEQEAGSGTGVREIHLSKNLNMPISEDALEALKHLSSESRQLVMLVCGFVSLLYPQFSCVTSDIMSSRKSTSKANLCNSSPTTRPLPPSPNSSRPSHLPSRDLPSIDSRIPMAARPAALSCSCTHVPLPRGRDPLRRA